MCNKGGSIVAKSNTGKSQGSDIKHNYSFNAVNDYNVRTYLLKHLKNKQKRQALIDEHKRFPRGGPTLPGTPPPLQSSVLAQLVDFLRTRPQTGKHTIVETIPWSEYSIGLLPGRRGGVVKILKEKYPTREEAEHAIFKKRVKALCKEYEITD